jgi:hypothetical protein
MLIVDNNVKHITRSLRILEKKQNSKMPFIVIIRFVDIVVFEFRSWRDVLDTTLCDNLFNNSVISWWSVLLVQKTGIPGENYRPVASHRERLSHKVVSSTSRHERNSNTTISTKRIIVTETLYFLSYCW